MILWNILSLRQEYGQQLSRDLWAFRGKVGICHWSALFWFSIFQDWVSTNSLVSLAHILYRLWLYKAMQQFLFYICFLVLGIVTAHTYYWLLLLVTSFFALELWQGRLQKNGSIVFQCFPEDSVWQLFTLCVQVWNREGWMVVATILSSVYPM